MKSLNQGVDPRTGEPVGDPIPDTGVEGVRSAVQRASACVPRLAGLAYADRGRLLNALATALRRNEDELIELADRETALGSPRLPGELARTATQLDMFADVLRDGDLAVGRENPIPFYGELGSINPVVVTGSAVHARGREVAEGLAGSFRLGTGQFCTKPGVVLVPAEAGFDTQVADAVRLSEPAPMLTARMRDAFQTGIAALAEVPGVRELVKAEPLEADGHDVLPAVLAVDAETFAAHADVLAGECFGPVTVLVEYGDNDSLHRALRAVPGSLTGSLHAEPGDPAAADIVGALRERVGRIIFDGWPTGVAVTWSQHHGGPWPATTDPLHTSVGATAIRRFLRPVTYQDAPDELLPAELRDGNPLGIPRRVDGAVT